MAVIGVRTYLRAYPRHRVTMSYRGFRPLRSSMRKKLPSPPKSNQSRFLPSTLAAYRSGLRTRRTEAIDEALRLIEPAFASPEPGASAPVESFQPVPIQEELVRDLFLALGYLVGRAQASQKGADRKAYYKACSTCLQIVLQAHGIQMSQVFNYDVMAPGSGPKIPWRAFHAAIVAGEPSREEIAKQEKLGDDYRRPDSPQILTLLEIAEKVSAEALSDSERYSPDYDDAAKRVHEDLARTAKPFEPDIRATVRGQQPLKPDVYLLHHVATVLLDCGLRPDECYRLMWHQIQDGAIFINDGKGKGSRRRVPVSDRVLSVLEMRRAVSKSEWVFPSATKSGHIEGFTIKKQHDKALTASEVARFVVYDFRHTRITRWARVLPLPVVQRLAGHTQISTTMHYVHVSDDDARAAMKKEQEERRGHITGHTEEKTDLARLAQRRAS